MIDVSAEYAKCAVPKETNQQCHTNDVGNYMHL